MLAQTRTKLATLVAIAAMTVILGVVHLAAEEARVSAQDRGRHARLGEVALTSLLVALLDAETGQRGFLTTRNDRYLEPYEAARSRITNDLATATPFVASDDLAALEDAVATKLAESAETIALGREDRFDEAVAIVNGDAGLRAMETARAIVQRNVERHAATRAVALDERAFWEVVTRVVTFGGLAAVALLVIVVWFGIRRDFAREEEHLQLIQTQSRELALKSEGLESLARKLEEHNESLATANRQLAVAVRERQKAIGDLERRNRDLDQFAYVTSHDLKAPLRAIANLTTWIEDDLGTNASAETRENLALLRRRTTRLELLIEGILAYSRAGRTRAEPGHEKTFAALVEETRTMLGIPEGLIRLERGGELGCPPEQIELGQVLANLLSNAHKHGGDVKPIRVSAEHDGCELVVRVRDEGPGIDPRFHDKIFEMFQTLAPRDEVEGAGIGLAIVKKLVLGVGGRVAVESAPGAGATFRVIWPIGATAN